MLIYVVDTVINFSVLLKSFVWLTIDFQSKWLLTIFVLIKEQISQRSQYIRVKNTFSPFYVQQAKI